MLWATLELEGQSLIAPNGGPAFSFTPAISMFVRCATQAEIDERWAHRCDGGRAMQCGWVADRFGASWQIVPDVRGGMLRDPDTAKSDRVMRTQVPMAKLDIAALTRACEAA